MVLVTADRKDFERLSAESLRTGQHHAGIIMLRQSGLGVGEIVRQLLLLAQSETAETIGDQIRYVSRTIDRS